MKLSEFHSRQTLDLFDERRDPWATRSSRERRVRYRELKRLLPRGPFRKALHLGCGEGEFSIEMTEAAFTIVGVDCSPPALRRARESFPQVAFEEGDAKRLSSEWFEAFDLVVWLDAIQALTREESADLLKRIAVSHAGRRLGLLLSIRVAPRDRANIGQEAVHGFESPQEFLLHVRSFFPDAVGFPVALNSDLRPGEALTLGQRLFQLGLKLFDQIGAHRAGLRVAWWAMRSRRTSPFVAPFVAEIAAVVDPGPASNAGGKGEATKLSDLGSEEALDRFYRREDPWSTRTNREKRIRYEELDRFLPAGPYKHALDLACGEGDVSSRLKRVAGRVSAADLSGVVLERARARFPAVHFFQADVRELQAERLKQFDLIVWLDAIYWLAREESARVLRVIAESAMDRNLTVLVSARIVPRERVEFAYWEGQDFESPRELLDHVWKAFPSARAVPVQINLDPVRLTQVGKAIRFGLKVLNHLGGYRLALHLTQRASTVPFLAPLVDPFIVHLAAIVEPGHLPFPRSVEDVTDRFLNRPLASRLVRWLTPTRVTPNQVTGISCLLGLAAAATLYVGSWPALIAGALLLQLSIVVDCADGQLARAKKLTSEWGEVFDHTSDDLSFLLISFVLALTVWQSDLGGPGKLVLVLASFGAALLLTASQYFYNEEYRIVAARGVGGGVREDRDRIRAAIERQPRGWRGVLARGLLRYYAFRLSLMHEGLTRLNPWRARLLGERPVGTEGQRAYWELQAFPLWLWRLAGMSSVALLLVAACLAGAPLWVAWLLAFAGVPYFGWVLWLQRRADRLTVESWTK